MKRNKAIKLINTKSGGGKFSIDFYNPNANKNGLGKVKAEVVAKMIKEKPSL